MRVAALLAALGVVAAVAVVHPESLAGQMAGHAALSVVAAPLLVIGAPAPLRRAAGRALAFRGAPGLAFAAFVAVHWTVHLVPAFMDHGSTLHPAGHLAVIVASVLFWLPVLVGPGGTRRLDGAAAALYLFLAMPAVDLVSVPLMGMGEPVAAATMLGGMLPLGAAALVATLGWVREEEREARAAEA